MKNKQPPVFTGALYPHQIEARDRALRSPEKGYGLFLEMGTGKTRVALNYLVTLLFVLGFNQRALVVCPRAVMPSWAEEVAATTVGLDVAILDGTRAQRLKKMQSGAQLLVVNYEGLLSIGDELLAAPDIAAVIFDESQRVSNRTAKQSKIAAKLAAKAKHVLLLSGTPVRNDARDLWHQLYLIDGGKRLGPKFWGFQAQNFVNVSRTPTFPVWKPRPGSEEKIRAAMSDVVYSVKKDEVLSYLPPKIYHRRTLNMNGEQCTAYIEMAREMLVELKEGKLATARTALTRYLRLHQIAQGFLMDDEKTIVAEWKNPKTAELLDILEEHKGKAIVWAIYRHTIRQLAATLTEKGYNPVTLYGETPDVGAVVSEFQNNPGVRVLIGQPQAGGLGITLTAADLSIYYTNSFSHENRSQSEDRCHRIGSERHGSVNYIDLVCAGTIDATILTALKRKADTADLLLDFEEHLKKAAA